MIKLAFLGNIWRFYFRLIDNTGIQKQTFHSGATREGERTGSGVEAVSRPSIKWRLKLEKSSKIFKILQVSCCKTIIIFVWRKKESELALEDALKGNFFV